MFRVSTLSLIAIIAIASLSWVLNGGSLQGPRQAGWTDLSTWGWGERGHGDRSSRVKTAAAAPSPKPADSAGVDSPPAATGKEPGTSKHAKEPAAPKASAWDVAEDKPKSAKADSKPSGDKLQDKAEPAPVAADAPVATESAKGVPHDQPWPIATDVPDWSAVMKVTGALPAVDWAFETAAAETTATAADDKPAESAAGAISWPVATEVPNWAIEMAVTGALPEVDWSQFPEPTVTAEADVSSDTTEVVVESKGVPHEFPWPVADEVPDWNIVLPDTTALDATVPAAAASDAALSVGVPHPFPWPIATEVPKWDMPLPMTAVVEPPPAAVNVTEPGISWPIATELPKWEGPRQPAPAPAPAAEVARRAELSVEQIACEDELRRIYKSGTILFKSDSAEIEKSSSGTLDKLAKAAKECKGIRIRVEGHTDSQGRTSYNQQLSERRAKAIIAYLTGAGVDGGNMSAYGYGADRPVASNDSEPNRQKNRRIEFTVY